MSTQKTVNMLPEWYRKELRQRRRLRLHLGFMVALGAGLVATAKFSQYKLGGIEREHASLQRQASVVRDISPEINGMKAEIERLTERQTACRELGATVPVSKMMQQILNDMSPGMTLSRLTVEVRNEAIKGSGFVGDKNNPPKTHDVARLVVVGVARDDNQANALFSKLSENPLFSEVAMTYIRREVLQAYEIRRFELQMTMDLDRLSMETPAEEASPAKPAEPVEQKVGGGEEKLHASAEVSHGS